MSILQKLSLALAGTAVVFMGVNPAGAVSLTKGGSAPVAGQGSQSTILGSQVIDFNSGTAVDPNGFATYSATNGIVQGSQANAYATPFGDTSKYLTISPVGSNVAGSTGSVTINFAKAIDYFGLYWGSVDTYNFVDVYSGGTLLKTFSGADVPGAQATGSWTSNADNVFVNLLASKGETFDKVVLRSNGRAFESDNHTYRLASVPESGSMLGLLAFGALSAGSFVKRKSKMA
ncbi:PEP-CTERM sorting domain-containing protein [Nostocaceae cyanobacterium CENA357]|uniref:PEP-CTERM sorting domain-containing protein n=1 Tax=Atlanticothrix silvestris CENA357 TaxID=1725252 RepID=A0A8J7HHQ0_9CYAN|nr:PEP-CTERM sorting domain-containing protein [Atlanticothrix silvestris]MBH8552771.1 PEP-CTERM sorting domain-containing protein [Atlanticothrix silvestris CENA357]